jgi:hypothetical protein
MDSRSAPASAMPAALAGFERHLTSESPPRSFGDLMKRYLPLRAQRALRFGGRGNGHREEAESGRGIDDEQQIAPQSCGERREQVIKVKEQEGAISPQSLQDRKGKLS